MMKRGGGGGDEEGSPYPPLSPLHPRRFSVERCLPFSSSCALHLMLTCEGEHEGEGGEGQLAGPGRTMNAKHVGH